MGTIVRPGGDELIGLDVDAHPQQPLHLRRRLTLGIAVGFGCHADPRLRGQRKGEHDQRQCREESTNENGHNSPPAVRSRTERDAGVFTRGAG